MLNGSNEGVLCIRLYAIGLWACPLMTWMSGESYNANNKVYLA